MSSVNLELIHHLWIPNIFIYNLKTFKGKDDRPFSTALTSTISVGEMEEWVSIYWTSSYGFHTQSVVNSVQRQVAPETLVSWGLRKRQKVKIYTSKKLLWDIYIFFGGGEGMHAVLSLEKGTNCLLCQIWIHKDKSDQPNKYL